MELRSRWIGLLVVAALVLSAGCKKTSSVSKPDKPRPKISLDEPDAPQVDKAASKGEETAPAKVVQREPPPPATIPKVAMPERLLATCKVKVGDPMPDDEGKALVPADKSLRSLFGKRLTVVLFWKAGNVYAEEALDSLAGSVAKPYRDKGVALVAINVKDPPGQAARVLEAIGESAFPSLLDPDGKYFAKVATEKLPRIYLLDASGKIIWFDLEYSGSTSQDLLTAIQVALGEKH